ncbi:uncharacterized protein Eint_020310 [Encephalitozoon intestinalis ATCC 50506]|uniref:Uncharacterized protein n=1 Tax=Encephalitozoon intestinalis (strain ATCC 50506) TaxID=876142 RepID=E0S5P7_ENCIT|nr:uncharacterized protein Eint_020310 [Encephalitozoon intestinalis ATCC 50506]ADM11032.1 hypothetical protein Eint_020310 [Encephalitozoon intestinalis ATCC 50506]UTX44680.1 hypothetical protein GPK93_02g01950 [Encephalitozoon intestinalis]
MNIKELIVRVLENRDIEAVGEMQYTEGDGEDLHELSTSDLLNCTSPYIRGVVNDKVGNKYEGLKLFKEYCEDCEYLKLVEEETIELCRTSGRDNKIKLWRKIREFRYDFIDWEDREWIMRLLEYFYIMSMKNIEHLNREIMLLQEKKDKESYKKKGIECIKVDSQGRISDFLARRNSPTMTLDEFAEKIMLGMEKGPSTSSREEEPEDSSSNNLSREELLKRDEERDEKEINRGNTTRMG